MVKEQVTSCPHIPTLPTRHSPSRFASPGDQGLRPELYIHGFPPLSHISVGPPPISVVPTHCTMTESLVMPTKLDCVCLEQLKL